MHWYLANVVTQSIVLLPLQASGNGSTAPNQWQIANGIIGQTMIITYANVGNTNANAFAVNTSNLSTGYTLITNSCSGGAFILTANSANVCQVILSVNTTTIGEKNLLLTPLTSTWTGFSTPQASVWVNPITLIAQSSVFVSIAATPPLPAANVVVQSIILSPLQASGNGSAAPNQWQIANGTSPQTMTITYVNTGAANAAAFTINTSSLSSGYSLSSNSCSGGAFTLTANSLNTCQVILNVSTTSIGEKDLFLTPLTSTWTGLSTPQASVWINPTTLFAQSSVGVNIAATPIPPAANVIVQSVTLAPIQASGNGSISPNQWQIANGTFGQTMTITYANTGAANAVAFAVNTSSLSSGYALNNNSCNGGDFTLTAGSLNTCQVVLNMTTTTAGEEDFFLTPLTSTWNAQSIPQPSIWPNPITLLPQASVFVNIAAAPPPVPTVNVVIQSITMLPLPNSGNGSATPNQWQIANGTIGQTIAITYANTGTADATNFAVDTSILSSGYTLSSNSCNSGAFILRAGSINTCQVILSLATTAIGEEDLTLMPVTWTGGSATSNWMNPITLVAQTSVFINITAPPPVPTVNVVVQSITMLPLPNSGNGSATPNQWQIANGTNPQTMIITYANTGTADAAAFAVNTTSLSAGYTLASNSCSGGVFTLTAGSLNTCQVILGLATATAGEEDLTLMPVAWTGGSATPNWLNPITLVGQSSVFVNISAVIPPPLLTPAIYGFSGVTNTSNPSPPFFGSVVNGEVDTPLTPTSITGLCTVTGCPGLVNGSIFTSGAAQVTAATVQALSLHTAATALAPACFATGVFTIPGGPGHNLSGKDLGTIGPLPAGVYCFSTTAGLTGTLTLSGGPTASYTFLIGSALTTASNSNVLLTNGTLHQNVFWDVGSGVTFGTGTSFQGVIDSSAAITDAGGSSLTGNAWSRDAAVTLIGTTITP